MEKVIASLKEVSEALKQPTNYSQSAQKQFAGKIDECIDALGGADIVLGPDEASMLKNLEETSQKAAETLTAGAEKTNELLKNAASADLDHENKENQP